MMNDRKRKFAAALRSGASQKEAAIQAGYSEKGAAQAGSRLAKDADVVAELARHEHVEHAKAEAKKKGKPLNLPDLAKMYSDPQGFLLAVMNDPEQDPRLRTDAAKVLMPYFHERKADVGKKVQKNEAAKKVANRFAVATPPRLVANGGKRV